MENMTLHRFLSFFFKGVGFGEKHKDEQNELAGQDVGVGSSFFLLF